MDEKRTYNPILFRDGVSARQRLQTVLLQPSYFMPDERSLKDIYNFAKEFAKKINFYEFESFEFVEGLNDLKVDKCKDGDWSAFFKNITEIEIDGKNDFDPHVVLFLSFIKLFSHTQNHLNQFTQKHIDFYYKKVLSLQPQTPISESAYVIFELAKSANELLIKKGELLDAGKINQRPSVYALTEDTIINKASIASIKTIFVNEAEKDVIRFAQQSNTIDGVAKKLPPSAPYYDAFGLRHIDESVVPKAKIGFAIASPMLLLREGTRNISIQIELYNVPIDLNTTTVNNTVELFLTGEKNWLGAYTTKATFGKFINSTQSVIISYQIPSSEPAILSYNNDIHKGNYNTQHPLVQVLINTTSKENLFSILKSAVVNSISIEIDVKDVVNLDIENDTGTLDSKKPFCPFGTTPQKGSVFNISHEELLKKSITGYEFRIEWLGVPQNFSSYYNEYGTGNGNSTFKANYNAINGSSGTTLLFNTTDATKAVSWPSGSFKVVSIRNLFNQSPIKYFNFYNLNTNPNYKTVINQPQNINIISSVFFNPTNNTRPTKGFINFELTRSFLQESYGKVFANKAIEKSKATDPNTVSLPNSPYTPTIKKITLDYKASVTQQKWNSTSFDDYNNKQIQLFHIGVFGQSEQHGYLKNFAQQEIGINPILEKNIFLLPQFYTASLLLGLKDVVPGQSVSILFQLAEGSSNPDMNSQNIIWHSLCSNEWRSIKSSEVLKNETNNLQQTGIINLVIPESATKENTIMDSGCVWISASVQANPEAICLFEKLIAQAAKASYQTNGDVAQSGILSAGAITKFINKSAGIKQLSQPYSSFGGNDAESNTAFMLRVSERLRHKQRAVMNWDFEHIVLQQFPQIYRTKCLNHFNDADTCCKTNCPGYITLVVLPKVFGKNFYNPLQPKVNTNIREQIKTYLQPLVSFFTTLFVVNPDYETLLLDFKVRFTTAGNFGLYADKLNTALKNYLTPWAFDENAEVHFGGAVNKSVLLNYIEEQPYVDFVTELKMFHVDEDGNSSGDLNSVTISNPKAILVSASNHIIKEYTENTVCT